MAKKQTKMTRVEILDTVIPIFAACWVMVFAYISLFNESGLLAKLTVAPILILYGLYLIGSALYCYKEVEILKAMERDYYEAEKRHRNKPAKLSKNKLITAAALFLTSILLFIFL